MSAGQCQSPAVCSCPRSPAAPACASALVEATDLQLLLAAVRARLQAGASAAPPGDALAQLVLECTQALHCLQELVAPEHRPRTLPRR